MSDPGPRAATVLPTNWDQYGVGDILRMVSENVDSRNWDQVASWRDMAILCDHHAARLRSAAAVLANHWSPAKNPVAREFMRYVDNIASSMSKAAATARTNAGALEAIWPSCSVLQRKSERSSRSVGASWRAIGYFAADKYDEQARHVMRETDAAIADARATMSLPPQRLDIRVPARTEGLSGGGLPTPGGPPGSQIPLMALPPIPGVLGSPGVGALPTLGAAPPLSTGNTSGEPELSGRRFTPPSQTSPSNGAGRHPRGFLADSRRLGWQYVAPNSTVAPFRSRLSAAGAVTQCGQWDSRPCPLGRRWACCPNDADASSSRAEDPTERAAESRWGHSRPAPNRWRSDA